MSYAMYLGGIQMPVVPGSIIWTTPNRDTTKDFVDGTQVLFSGGLGLRKVTFTLLLPRQKYDFAVYPDGFVMAEEYLDRFREWKRDGTPVTLLLVRKTALGEPLVDTEMTVVFSQWEVTEDSENFPDIKVLIHLCEYRAAEKKSVNVVPGTMTSSITPPEKYRNGGNWTVAAGETLFSIAKQIWGDGTLWKKLYEANAGQISTPSKLSAGTVLYVPGWAVIL